MNAGKQTPNIRANTQTQGSVDTGASGQEVGLDILANRLAHESRLPRTSEQGLAAPSRATPDEHPDRMSGPRSPSVFGADASQSAWEQQLGDAKQQWESLSQDELLRLVQERYAITREEAATQIDRFFDKHRS